MRDKKIERIKTIFIGILLILVIYQFYDEWNDKSIVELIAEKFETNTESSNEYILKPESFMISLGSSHFVRVKEKSLQEKFIEKYSSEIIKYIYGSRIGFEVNEDELTDVLNNKCIVLLYNDDYYSNVFDDLFYIKNDKVQKSLDKMSMLIICPNESDLSKTNVYILSDDDIARAECNIDTTELYGLIDEINMFDDLDVYVLSNQISNANKFNKIIFIPEEINDNHFEDNVDINLVNPFDEKYIEDGNQSEIIENYANIFFENPRAKWKMEKDSSTYIYGDGEKSLTIYKEGLVNYSYIVSTFDDIDINKAYEIAMTQIEKDNYLNGNIKLANVKKMKNGYYEFDFDYYANNIKLKISDSIKNKYDINYPLSIQIQGKDVVSYKALILKHISRDKSRKSKLISYEEIMNSFTNNYPNEMIDKMELAYYKKDINVLPNLSWVIETKTNTYAYNAIR